MCICMSDYKSAREAYFGGLNNVEMFSPKVIQVDFFLISYYRPSNILTGISRIH